jgi:pyruvate dehydrogenase E2 component (dihydrolipoamide acetyltransferase)
MNIDIIVPPLSQTSDTLVLVAWLKQAGDAVTKGEPLFEVETDKATLEVEAPATGTLCELLAEPGAEVAVRSVIGVIAVPIEETASAGDAPANGGQARRAPMPSHPHTPPPRLGGADRLFASPRARTLAEREGVALDGIPATGPQGMIVERDVRAYLAQRGVASAPPSRLADAGEIRATPVAQRLAAKAGVDLSRVAPAAPGAPIRRADVEAALKQRGADPKQPPAAPRDGAPVSGSRRVPLSPTRRTIARRLQASQRDAVPVTLTREVDATALAALRERLLQDFTPDEARLTYTDLLVSITARCLQRHPHLNASFDGDALELFEAVHLGLAVDTERGLVVPVLRDAAGMGLKQLAAGRAALVQRAQAGTLTLDEMAGGTFTLTNLGALGVDAFTPVLNPPQVAILGLGRIRPVVGAVATSAGARQVMWLSLTFDHRAVDGAPAARLLADIASLVEQPDRIWL